jgi:hypothetical protein
MLVRATVALAIMRLAALLPFRTIAGAIGLLEGQAPDATDPADAEYAAQIGWAVRSAAAHAPWKSTCLMQALAAAALLRRREIGATLYLGVAKEAAEPGGMIAHAWLRCGALVLTGDSERERFTVLASFALAGGDVRLSRPDPPLPRRVEARARADPPAWLDEVAVQRRQQVGDTNSGGR